MKKTVRFLLLLAILSLSCNSITGLSAEPALVEATGPIHGLTVAASLDDQGWPVDASFTFPPDQPQMVVLVRIGEVAPGSLTFSWYRVTEAGDEALFEQTVEVKAGDAAFSTGLNPGILAVGTYKVVATFGGESESIAWDVAESQSGDSTAPAGATGSAAGAAPAPGPSGTTTVVVPQPAAIDGPGPSSHANFTQSNTANQVKFDVRSFWLDEQNAVITSPGSFTIRVTPAIIGESPGVSREFSHPAGIDEVKKLYVLNPCALPGERDVPGTSITVTTVPVGYEANADTSTTTLGPDTTKPIVELDPPDGYKVKPNEQIVLTVNASEVKSGESWQTGIYKITVTGPEGDVGKPWINSSNIPLSCTHKTWDHPETFTYTVPPNPKAVIELCVVVEDYKIANFVTKCLKYPTGNTWKGTIKSVTTGDYGSAGICVGEAWELDFSVVVGEDGTVTGSGDGHLVSMPQCSGPGFDGSELATQAQNVRFDVEGRLADDEFELKIIETYIDGASAGLYNYSLLVDGLLLVPLVSDKAAEGPTESSFTGDGFVATGSHAVKMICTTCEEEPVSLEVGGGAHYPS